MPAFRRVCDRRANSFGLPILDLLHAFDHGFGSQVFPCLFEPFDKVHHRDGSKQCQVLFAFDLGVIFQQDLRGLGSVRVGSGDT